MIKGYLKPDPPSILTIKALDEDEYRDATSNGYVYGLVRGNSNEFTYIELGKEVEYDPPERVEPKEGRKFLECKCWFALTESDLDSGKFNKKPFKGTVILYYF